MFPFPTNCNIILFLRIVQVLKEVHYFSEAPCKALRGPLTLKVGGGPATLLPFWPVLDLSSLGKVRRK